MFHGQLADTHEPVGFGIAGVEFRGAAGGLDGLFRFADAVEHHGAFGVVERFVGSHADGAVNIVHGLLEHAALHFGLFSLVVEVGVYLFAHEVAIFVEVEYRLAIAFQGEQGARAIQQSRCGIFHVGLGEAGHGTVLQREHLQRVGTCHAFTLGGIAEDVGRAHVGFLEREELLAGLFVVFERIEDVGFLLHVERERVQRVGFAYKGKGFLEIPVLVRLVARTEVQLVEQFAERVISFVFLLRYVKGFFQVAFGCGVISVGHVEVSPLGVSVTAFGKQGGVFVQIPPVGGRIAPRCHHEEEGARVAFLGGEGFADADGVQVVVACGKSVGSQRVAVGHADGIRCGFRAFSLALYHAQHFAFFVHDRAVQVFSIDLPPQGVVAIFFFKFLNVE